MLRIFSLILLVLTTSVVSLGQAPTAKERDKALQRINACLRRNEVSSRECKHQNRDVATLVEVYKSGDKSVLPTLLHFTYLTDFYDEALLSDPDEFLTAMAQLPPKEQQDVADGIAGEIGYCSADRFKAMQNLLESVPDSSATKGVAEVSLKTLETKNAWHLLNYFPPGTFPGPACNLQVAWYSSGMHELGEKPLWPPSAETEPTFRLTHKGAFSGPRAVTLTIQQDGSASVRMTMFQGLTNQTRAEQSSIQPAAKVSEFLEDLNRAHYWEMPTQTQQRGLDGAVWIIEGVQNGKYRVVVRWCPGEYEKSSEDDAFADAGRLLFQLAGFKYTGSC